MNVFRQELKFEYKSFLCWASVLACLFWLFAGIYPSFAEESEAFLSILKGFPPFLLKSFGIDFERFFRPEAYLGFIYHYLELILAMAGLVWGMRLFGREKNGRMSDFLLSKSSSRFSLAVQKMAVGLLLCFACQWVILLLLPRFPGISGKMILHGPLNVIVLSAFILQLFMFFLGTFLAALLKRIGSFLALSSSLTFTFFLFLLIGRLTERDLFLKISPFSYVDPTEIIRRASLLPETVALAIAGALLFFATLCAYCRRDVEA